MTHTLWETDLLSRSVSSGRTRVEYDVTVKVPDQGPPSLDKTDNQVIWELQVNLRLPRVPKNTSHFRLKVSPEVFK